MASGCGYVPNENLYESGENQAGCKSLVLVEIVFTNAYCASVIVAQLMWLYVCYGDSFNRHIWKEVVSVIFPKLLFYFFLAMHTKRHNSIKYQSLKHSMHKGKKL